jgi:hypothetical protein
MQFKRHFLTTLPYLNTLQTRQNNGMSLQVWV